MYAPQVVEAPEQSGKFKNSVTLIKNWLEGFLQSYFTLMAYSYWFSLDILIELLHIPITLIILYRNLRIREDTAKYLLNLDVNSSHYDPKTRSMREDPLPDADPNEKFYEVRAQIILKRAYVDVI